MLLIAIIDPVEFTMKFGQKLHVIKIFCKN